MDNLDNGPENQSHRTQFLNRLVTFAQTMTWKGKAPVVGLLTTVYHTGVRLTKQAMAQVETCGLPYNPSSEERNR